MNNRPDKKVHAVQYALLICLLLAVPTSIHVFALNLVYFSSEEINLGPCWRKDILKVKGQAQIIKYTF